MLRDPVGSPHVAYLRAPASGDLTPFAMWAALPPSDYYGVSVAMGPPLIEALTPQAISRFVTMLCVEPGLGRPLIP
jgi:hypothetical protein